jgi:DNA-directed RNA polymerase specialized sigma24 family protein
MAADVAFEILYKEYYVRVFGLCRRLLNSSTLAEDATQETFMRAYRRFGKYDTDQSTLLAMDCHHCQQPLH